jgi:hypothetical protein
MDREPAGSGEAVRVRTGRTCKGKQRLVHGEGVFLGAIVPNPEGIITAGHDNKTARTVAYRRDEPINEQALIAMFRQIIVNNRAGGWRKLKAGGSSAPS